MNYDQIIAATKAYSDKKNVHVTDMLDTFIIMSEARMNRKLRVREMSARHSINTLTGQPENQYPLPDDYMSMRNIYLLNGTSKQTMVLITPQEMNDAEFVSGEGGGYYYTVIENMLQITPAQDTGNSIEMSYYKRIPSLVSNATNWVSLAYPDLYLTSIMGEIESFVKNKEGADAWFSKFSTLIEEVSINDASDRWSGSPLVMRIG